MFHQLLINGLITASIYILVGIGFSLIYSTTNFFHFTHGVLCTAGAYFAFLFAVWLGCPFWLSVLLGLVCTMGMGVLIEYFIYRQLRKRKTNVLVLLLSSLGIYILLQNTISIIFGDETKIIRTETVQVGLDILDARITPVQIFTIFTSIILVVVLSIFLNRTKIGSAMRAVANDLELASVSGINSDVVILWAFAIGSGLAGLAGILIALDVNMTPTMGMHILMMGVIATIISGGSIPGIALGALLLAMVQHFGAWFIGSQWQDAIAFAILVLFLLFKPEGFFGKKIGNATV